MRLIALQAKIVQVLLNQKYIILADPRKLWNASLYAIFSNYRHAFKHFCTTVNIDLVFKAKKYYEVTPDVR